jgi:hypothetical protein
MPSPLGAEFTMYIDDLPWHCLVTNVEIWDPRVDPYQEMRLTVRMWPMNDAPRRSDERPKGLVSPEQR